MRWTAAVASVICLLAVTAQAQGPASVLLVINNKSPVSKSIAEYYQIRRHIPSSNLCRIEASTEETIPREAYRTQIWQPVVQCLQSRGLTDRILYIVTTLGVPLRVAGKATGQAADGAAVDSELALLYSDMLGRPHPEAGQLPNPFFGQRNAAFSHPRFPIYLVTRLAAYDFNGVRALIDRGLQAQNRGKVVIDMKEAADDNGDAWLKDAAILLPKERVVLDDSTKVLEDEKDVIGYASWGSNDPARKKRFPGFAWLPGAIATEYVSTDGRTFQKPPETWTIGKWTDPPSAWFAGAPQSLTADLILEGATGASGHVDEPFLSGTPRPQLLFPAYLGGRNLAESYYLAIPTLSWMNIVVGDPLVSLGPANPR